MFICTELIEETGIPQADFWPGSDKFESWKNFTHLTRCDAIVTFLKV